MIAMPPAIDRRRLVLSLAGLAVPRLGTAAVPAATAARIAPSAPAEALAPATAAQVAELARAARREGRVNTLGMPDDWANWGGLFAEMKRRYGIAHTDVDLDSAEEIVRIDAEREHPVTDVGDVGFEFGSIAKARGITRAFKPSTWDQVPAWAKDADGHWVLAYTGTIAFAVNRRRLARAPRSWRELFATNARVSIGEVGHAAQSSASVLAAAIALGGDETRLQPALAEFARLAAARRLVTDNPNAAKLARGEADVFLLWDFNALSYRARLRTPSDYEVLIPEDGSVTSGYTTLINRFAPHPAAAQLVREFALSDEGQRQFARGHARPIRAPDMDLPAALRRTLLDNAQYRVARPVRTETWRDEARRLTTAWDRTVMQAGR